MTAEVAPVTDSTKDLPPRKTFELLNVLVEKVTGTVKWFSTLRCYGFIQRNDNKEDVFVHRTAIKASRQRFPTLRSGEIVEFSVVETTGGVNAASVTGPEGKPVKGFRIYPRQMRQPRKSEGEGNEKESADNAYLHVNGAAGDVEGTRRSGNFRGGRGRRFSGRRPARPMHNGMGDQRERPEGEQREEGVSPTGGAPRPRPRNRRGGRGRRGGPSGEGGVDRTAVNAQQAGVGDEYYHENGEGGQGHASDSRPPRRGGRLRRDNNRRQSGGNRPPKSDGASGPAAGSHLTDLPLENHLEAMKISDDAEKLDKKSGPVNEHAEPTTEKPKDHAPPKTETKEKVKKSRIDSPNKEHVTTSKTTTSATNSEAMETGDDAAKEATEETSEVVPETSA